MHAATGARPGVVRSLIPARSDRPITFIVWITVLADIVVAAAPFTQSVTTSSKVFTAVINMLTGVAVISLVRGGAERDTQWPGRRAGTRPAVPVVPPGSPGPLRGRS
jgi:hypothetical protein